MKRLLTIIICLSFNLCVGQSEWRHLYNSPTTSIIYTVDCPNDSTCYFGTADGTVFKTVDGGQTFTTLNVGAVGKIHAVSFQSPLKGYVLARNGVFKTLDGGISWYTVRSYYYNNVYGDMKFYNDSLGVVACNADNNYFTGCVYTDNAGLSWGNSIGGFQLFFDVEFLTPDIIFVAGYGGIRRTTTGPLGAWNILSVNAGALYDISVVDSSHLYAVAPLSNLTVKSNDLGDTWSVIDSSTSRTTWGCYFVDSLIGYGCGASGSNCMLSNTNDAGATWTDTVFNSVSGFIYRITFPSPNAGYAVGPGGNIFKYGDACHTTSTINPVSCHRYTSPSGNHIWNASGTYTDYMSNATGCDSIITVNLTINYSASSQTITTCNPYISPSGNYTWTTSGIYTDTITNGAGCDSIITIDLISKSISTQTITSCNYTSPSGNYIWTTSGTYMDTIPNVAGCDSILTINLTVNNSTSIQSITSVSCHYISPSGNYTWDLSGTYIDTIPNSFGCDSILTINLTINGSTSFHAVTSCVRYISPSGNYIWTTSGTYMDTIQNSVGCDSVMTFNLTITSVITTVTANGISLTANALNANYQWIDCSTMLPITGAINKTFSATASGNFAVIVWQNGCLDTSSCYTVNIAGLVENNANNNFEIVPNPVLNICTITAPTFTNATFVIYDITGRTLLQQPFNTKATIDISTLNNGVYIAEVKDKEGLSVKGKVVKE